MLTFEAFQALTYPGAQPLHANMHVDESGYWFGDAGKILNVSLTNVRQASNDITLASLSTTERIWGLTKDSNSQWIVLTRETVGGTIGRLYWFQEDGTFVRFSHVPAIVTGLNAATSLFRAPKAVFEIGGNYYVRVVRGDGVVNMRFLRFDEAGDVQADDLQIDNDDIDRLSDAASGGENGFWVCRQDTRVLYAININNFKEIPSLRTQLTAQNTSPFALSVSEGTAYVGDTNNRAYLYTGAEIPKAADKSAGGFIPLIGIWASGQIRNQAFNRREEEAERRRRLGLA